MAAGSARRRGSGRQPEAQRRDRLGLGVDPHIDLWA